jgi:hypothetical protein
LVGDHPRGSEHLAQSHRNLDDTASGGGNLSTEATAGHNDRTNIGACRQ